MKTSPRAPFFRFGRLNSSVWTALHTVKAEDKDLNQGAIEETMGIREKPLMDQRTLGLSWKGRWYCMIWTTLP